MEITGIVYAHNRNWEFIMVATKSEAHTSQLVDKMGTQL